MLLKTFSRVVAMSCCALGAAGCQFSPEMTERTLAYNQAVARSTNQELLLNILRASDREPRYFTHIGANQAQTTLTDSLTLTLPIAELNGGSSVGSGGMTPSASAQNTLTLDNLDDKKYQVGANAPVDASTVEMYWNQGLQPDVLGLLFIDTITIPTAEIQLFRQTVGDFCLKHQNTQRFCKYIKLSTGAAPMLQDDGKCFDEKLVSRESGHDVIRYINDPAWEVDATEFHPQTCFVTVLRALLALGLHPLDGKSNTEVATDLDDTVIGNPRFRAEMIKASMTVTKQTGSGLFHVTKEDKGTTFEIDSEAMKNFTNGIAENLTSPSADFTAVFSKDEQAEFLKLPCPYKSTKGAAGPHAQMPRRSRHTRGMTVKVSPASSECLSAKSAVGLADVKINLHIRSFEAVIYYLGEVARAEKLNKPAPQVAGKQLWGAPAKTYEEDLFRLERANKVSQPVIVVRDDRGAAYSVPDFCEDSGSRDPSCNSEYPAHESMTVLTIVNQLWGLQKEPSDKSPTPTLSLGK